MCSFAETTHTPQGDGNLNLPAFVHPHARNNPHPARGRKLHSFDNWIIPYRKQPIPRKGTETSRPARRIPGAREIPHTPQGDGNVAKLNTFTRLKEIPYTPQGDGNSSQFSTDSSGDFQNDLHPARGRKLALITNKQIFTARKNSRPARGRKLPPRRQLGQHDLGNNPHPARGRKLITPVQLAKFMKEILYTPPGDN